MHKYSSKLLTTLMLSAALTTQAQSNIDAEAISQTDSRISGWATACTVTRGWADITDHTQGLASFGTESNAVGPAAGSTHVVSLGDSGIAVLTFATPIRNLEGPDFAVFENGFLDGTDPQMAFLEFAFVEVSSDGQHFVRFPAHYTGPDTPQCTNWTYVDGRHYTNLAGRYILGYGTPFDLEELKDSAGIDVDHITHVRLIDVIGSTDPAVGSADAEGNMINDPFPSPYASGGFDLAGVAVLNHQSTGLSDRYRGYELQLVPNPVHDQVQISSTVDKNFYYRIVNVLGQEMQSGTVANRSNIDVSGLTAGQYYVLISADGWKGSLRMVKQ